MWKLDEVGNDVGVFKNQIDVVAIRLWADALLEELPTEFTQFVEINH